MAMKPINIPEGFAESIRADERQRIADHLHKVGVDAIRDPTSDGIDGYCGACIIELAETIRRNGIDG